MDRKTTVKNTAGAVTVESLSPAGGVTIRSDSATITVSAEGAVSIEAATNVSVSAGVLMSLKAAELNLSAAATTVQSAEVNFTGASVSVEAAEITLTGNVAIVGEGTLNGVQLV